MSQLLSINIYAILMARYLCWEQKMVVGVQPFPRKEVPASLAVDADC